MLKGLNGKEPLHNACKISVYNLQLSIANLQRRTILV